MGIAVNRMGNAVGCAPVLEMLRRGVSGVIMEVAVGFPGRSFSEVL